MVGITLKTENMHYICAYEEYKPTMQKEEKPLYTYHVPAIRHGYNKMPSNAIFDASKPDKK